MKNISKKTVVLLIISAILLIVLAVYQNQKEKQLDDIIKFPLEQLETVDVQFIDKPELQLKLNGEDKDNLLKILGQAKYKKMGKSNSLQDCYARIFLELDSNNRTEIMLAESYMLVNDLESSAISTVYCILSEGKQFKEYILTYVN